MIKERLEFALSVLKEKTGPAIESIREKSTLALNILREKTTRAVEKAKPHIEKLPEYKQKLPQYFLRLPLYYKAASTVGLVFVLTVSIYAGTNGLEKGDDLCPGELLEISLEEDLPLAEPVINAVYIITADGEEIVALATMEEAQAVLDGKMDRYKTKGSEIKDLVFKEMVGIEAKEVDDSYPVFSVEDAINYVITGTTEPRIYIVQGGDTLWDIAIANGISPYALQDMNPGFDPKRMRIGQEIFLYETFPFITVSFTEIVTVSERIPYQVVYENNDTMYRGQSQVKSVGTFGSKEVVSEITKENGVTVSSVVLSETIVTEPVTQVAYRGTLPTPVYTGTSSGELSQPVGSMNVISQYGRRGGRQHHGVDLKGPVGTPIYAAADGVVTFSGSSGSYGLLVKISHGNGLETRYSHNSENFVSVGDVVTAGQHIAAMGATGNATTSHLHFEVRINGASKNPMNYI